MTELQQAAAADRRQQLQADQEMRIQQQMLLLQYAKVITLFSWFHVELEVLSPQYIKNLLNNQYYHLLLF